MILIIVSVILRYLTYVQLCDYSYFQGSLKIYKIPLPPDIEDSTIMGGDPQYGLFQGLPNNDPIHVLVRIYLIKVSSEYIL